MTGGMRVVGSAVVRLNGHSVRFIVRFFVSRVLLHAFVYHDFDRSHAANHCHCRPRSPDSSRILPSLTPDVHVPNLKPFHRYRTVPGREPESCHRDRPIRDLTPIKKRGHGNRSLDLSPGVTSNSSGVMHPTSSELFWYRTV